VAVSLGLSQIRCVFRPVADLLQRHTLITAVHPGPDRDSGQTPGDRATRGTVSVGSLCTTPGPEGEWSSCDPPIAHPASFTDAEMSGRSASIRCALAVAAVVLTVAMVRRRNRHSFLWMPT